MRGRIIAAVLGAVGLVAADAAAGPFFRTSSTNILDTNNAVFLMRGQGLNGWLVPEAYQLRLNAVHNRHIGSLSDIHQRIQELLQNTNDAKAFWDLYYTNYVTLADLGIFKTQGFNTVRVPFNYRLLQPQNSTNTWDNSGFQVLSNIIAWCRTANLGVILDMHSAPGGQSGDAHADPEWTYWASNSNYSPPWVEVGVACLWATNADYTAATGRTPEWNRQRTVNIWREIAKRFKNETQIVGYELLNEPYLPAGVNWPVLRGLLTNITVAIRAEDTNHMLFVEGNYFSGTFEGLFPAWDSNVVYVFHRYWSPTTTADIQTFLNARTNKVPVVMGETGENSNPWFYQFKNVLESNNVGWCWWGWKKVDSIAGAYSAYVTTNYQYVIDNFRDTPVDTNIVKAGLMEMATNLQTSLCRYEPGYFPALRDPQYDVFRKSYAHLTAPGLILATYYDVGDAGTAYSDTRYKQEDGFGGESWNSGWCLRNDGVDIYATTSGLGNNFKVGSIDANEWIRYTIDAPVSGRFDAVVRVANESANAARIRLRVNSTSYANTTVPKTGSYESWTNLYYGKIDVPQGSTNRLEIAISAGGYDLASITLYPTNNIQQNLGYFNHPATNPAQENLPGTNGFGSFLQVDYAKTTTTFFVLAPWPTVAPHFMETGQVSIKISFYHPESNEWYNLYARMSNVAEVALTTNAPFHGLPTSYSTTVGVYRFDWNQPRGPAGQPLTNEITVSYAPYFQSFSNGVETARRYLAMRNPQFTNSYPVMPQYFATNYLNTDYSYINQFPVVLDGVRLEYGYFNNPATNPTQERVPGTNGFGSFLQVNYSITTTSFFVLAPWPSVAQRYMETGQVAIKISYYHPESNEWYNLFTRMSNVAQVALSTNSQFHGLPASGSATVDVYRFDWDQPRGLTGQPLTNELAVFYAPYFQSFSNGVETTRRYFAVRNPEFTNSYPINPQYFATNFFNTDYALTNLFPSPSPDADGDGVPDAIDNCPITPNPDQSDLDGDGLGNECDDDLDGDGMPNTWESDNELNPSNATDAAADADGDRMSNRDEFLSGTRPKDDTSFLHMTWLRNATNNSVELCWSSVTGKNYVIDRATNFLNGLQFEGLESNIPGSQAATSYTDTNPGEKGLLFYRAWVQ